MYPFWISEGLATSFEFDEPADAPPGASSLVRLQTVAEARCLGRLVPLRRFLLEAQGPLEAEASRLYYAQAWALFRYALDERPDELSGYLRTMAGSRLGRRSPDKLMAEFVAAFGSLEGFEHAWTTFLERQRLWPPGSRAATRP